MINLIIRVSSYCEEKFRKFPRAVWTEEGGFVHNNKYFEYQKKNIKNKKINQKTDIQIQTLRKANFTMLINHLSQVLVLTPK